MKNVQSVLALLMVILMILTAASGLAETVKTEDVKKVSVETKPDKTVYMIGEAFDPTGGVLEVTYKDKSTAQVPMTDANVTFSGTNFSSEGKKSVTIEFGGKSVRLSVTVSASGCTVIFDSNDGTDTHETLLVPGGSKIEEKVLNREGYTLEGWFTDLDYKEKYDFTVPVTGDMTLYAFWKNNNAEYVNASFDYAFYGVKLTGYTRLVEKGASVAQPDDPERTGYAFDGWYADAALTVPYDFSQPVNSDTTITAKWLKTVQGVQSNVFEAEDTDLTGKEGVGSSGVSTEKSMIQFDADGTLHPSNGRWVGFLYKNGLTLDFCFASDMETTDATISLSLSTELPGSITFDRNNYSIILNGEELAYVPFTLALTASGNEAKNPFETFVIMQNAHLLEGENTLVLRVNNNTSIQGTTYQAVGPMVDCVKIETEAVLTWDETKGLPAKNY